jgi:tetratricopeptide (TPR) repeat protein
MPLRTLPFRPLAAILAAMLLLAASASAQQPPERNYTLTDKTSEELGKIQPLLTAKNIAGALAVIDGAASRAQPNSYDMAILMQVKAQIYLQNNELAKAIEPLERCLQLSNAQTPTFFEARATQEYTYYLAALYYQEGAASKDPAVAERYMDKAEQYITTWSRITPKPAPETLSFYASLLYQRAVADADKVDADRLRRALEQTDRALRLSTHPRDNFYQLKLACLLQLNRNREAAEILELLIKQKPDNRTYWQQLAALYLSIGEDIRSIVTIERAQNNGHMNTPKDNFNLVGIYFNIGQYEKAAELLEKGLTSGSIENDPKNWELLSFSYQQLRQELKSIDALKRAAKAFPDNGQFDYLIAQAYFSMERTEDAFKHAKDAVRKGNLARPHAVNLLLAYVAFELKKFDDALAAVNTALTYPEGATDGARMKTAIEDAIRERQAQLQKM